MSSVLLSLSLSMFAVAVLLLAVHVQLMHKTVLMIIIFSLWFLGKYLYKNVQTRINVLLLIKMIGITLGTLAKFDEFLFNIPCYDFIYIDFISGLFHDILQSYIYLL